MHPAQQPQTILPQTARLALGIAMGLLVWTACAGPQQPAPDPGPKLPDGVVASVGETTITGDQLRAYADSMRTLSEASDVPTEPEARLTYWRDMLNLMVEEELVRLEAARLNLTIDSTELDRAIADIAARNQITLEALNQELERQKIDVQLYRTRVASMMLRFKLLYSGADPILRAQIPLEELKAAYQDKHGRSLPTVKVVRLATILIPNGDNPAAARQRAEKLRSQLMMGSDFATIAREHSSDANAPNGGLINADLRQGELIPDIETAVFTLNVGGISPVVELPSQGFRIFKVISMREEAATVEIEELARFEEEMRAKATAKAIDTFKERHPVTLIDDDQLLKALSNPAP